MRQRTCQLCGSSQFVQAIDLGFQPLADTFLPADMLYEPEMHYPLKTYLCEECGYMGLGYVVSPEERYQKVDYSYTAGNSRVSVSHFAEFAKDIAERTGLEAGGVAVDIGSNDGTLLTELRAVTRCAVVGVEPAHNIAEISRKNGVAVVEDFFSQEVAAEISKTYGKARVITATNVFNHVTNLPIFMTALSDLLHEDGYFVFETPSLLDLVTQVAFDTVYLEHVSYFGVRPLRQFFSRYGLSIAHVEENNYMGGSLRVFVGRHPEAQNLAEYVQKEETCGIYSAKTYISFMEKVRQFKVDLCRELYEVKAKGGKIVAIGAATKGNTLLNYCNIDATLVEFVTDSSPLKVGKFMPGSHLPIKLDTDINSDITHGLILPWNIGNFLKQKLQHLNLTFIIPHLS